MTLRLLCLFSLIGTFARADVSEANALDRISNNFEYGKFEETLAAAEALLEQPNLPENVQAPLHQLAGLSAFNLGKVQEAKLHFASVLRLWPDQALDPFSVPPPAIAAFEEVRQNMGPALDAIRYEQRLRAERVKKEADERMQKAQAEAKQHSLALQNPPREQPLWVNFLPFGAGQFQQGRTGLGLGLAIGEAALAAGSIAGYIGFALLYEDQIVTLQDVQTATGKGTVLERGIPASKRGTAQTLKWLQLGAGAGFWASYAFGVVEALVHRRGPSNTQTTVETVVSSGKRRPERQDLHPDLSLSPLPGGGAAALSFNF